MVVSARDAYGSLPSEYQTRVSQILANPPKSSKPPMSRYPRRSKAPIEALSERTRGVLKRTFGFWCKQTVEGAASTKHLSPLGFVAFCRAARVVSDLLTHAQLLQIFDDNMEEAQQILAYNGFLTAMQQVADAVTQGDLNQLLSEFILPHTAGSRLDAPTKVMFTTAVQKVLQLHMPTLRVLYERYQTVVRAPRLEGSKLSRSRCPSGVAGSTGITLEAFKTIGTELILWPELKPSDVKQAFVASLGAPTLCFDAMCECMVRCCLAMLGPLTPVDWVCSCLHQMLYSVSKQLNPPITNSPPPSTSNSRLSNADSAGAGPSDSISIQMSRYSPPASPSPLNSPAAALQLAGAGVRRTQSAFGVLDRLAAVIAGDESPNQNPRTAELHSELLRARDRLVSTLVPRQSEEAAAGAVTHSTSFRDDETDFQLQEYLAGKRERLMASAQSSRPQNSSWGLENQHPDDFAASEYDDQFSSGSNRGDVFSQLDKNGDGVIDRAEFKALMAGPLGDAVSRAHKMPDLVSEMPQLVQADERRGGETRIDLQERSHAAADEFSHAAADGVSHAAADGVSHAAADGVRRSKQNEQSSRILADAQAAASGVEGEQTLRNRADDIKARITKAYQQRSGHSKGLSTQQLGQSSTARSVRKTTDQVETDLKQTRGNVGLIAQIQALDRARQQMEGLKENLNVL